MPTERSKPEIVMVAAVARNGVIGREGDMPWRLPSDLKHFKAVTMGQPMIMGRKTFDAIGKPLPGRATIVVSRSVEAIEGADVADSLDRALALAVDRMPEGGENRICIIGGGEIYRQAMDRADELDVTHVEAAIEGDTVFPPIDPAVWECVSERPQPAGERDSHDMRFAVYRRRR